MLSKLDKPGFWMSVLLTFMAVMVQMFISLPLTTVDSLIAQKFPNSSFRLADEPFVIGFVNIVAFGAATLTGILLNRPLPRRIFPFAIPTALQFGAMVLTILGADILLSEVDNLFRWLAKPPDWLLEFYRRVLSSDTNLAGRLFLLVLVAPVTEELLFRGVILRGLLTRFPAWLAVAVAAFLFAAGHVNPWQFISAFWIGLIFGWFYLRTGSVLACILGHAISNGFFVLFTSAPVEIPGLTGAPDAEVTFQPLWLDLSGAVLLVLGIVLFVKATRSTPAATSDQTPPVISPALGMNSADPNLMPPVIGPQDDHPPRLPPPGS